MAHRGRCRSQGSFYFEFGFDVDFNDILYNDHEYHDGMTMIMVIMSKIVMMMMITMALMMAMIMKTMTITMTITMTMSSGGSNMGSL